VLQEEATRRLLIVDADPAPLNERLRQRFPEDCRIETAETGEAAIQSIMTDPPDVIFLDPNLPDQCGLAFHRQVRRIDSRIPVIFVSDDRTADAAIKATQQGAIDYLFKPLDDQQIDRAVEELLHLAQQMTRSMLSPAIAVEDHGDGALSGGCLMMREVYKSIGLVAGQDVNVLITGESGTGKELVARAIVRHSSRSEAPFLALNCAAIPEHLLESELFGHEKGAFSGAERRRIGKFEQYTGGTILLDEIGDMPLHLQAKILRLIQEQNFQRVGGNETVQTNVRLIASTHRDLKSWVAQGKFRADLYYRLSVFTIHLPPLRDRGEDIPMLVSQFVKRYSRELGRQTCEIDQDAMERLQRYHWPGNIRELQSVIRQALLRCNGKVLLPGFLPQFSDVIPERSAGCAPMFRNFDLDEFLRQHLNPDACNLYADLHRELDRHSLARVMTYTLGNRRMASRFLGIARQTLRAKLRESGLLAAQGDENQEAELADDD
jgi:two-component system nitrogen regulation response regulator GlnG